MTTMREAPDATVVTGAAGWLGSALMEALTSDASGWARTGTIRALVTNRAEGARLQALSPAVEPVIGDVTDAESLAPLFAGLDGRVDVIHTAGVIHPRRTDQFERMPLFRGAQLEVNADYYVRVRAHSTPRIMSFVWPWQADDVVGLAKFTFMR